MEQDIDVLKELRKELGLYADKNKIKQGIALEHLIKAYKELEKELNSVKEIYYTQKEIEGNYIPVSLVEEKIEEYKKLLMSCNRFSDVDRIKAINERILAYEELLNTKM